MALFLLVGGAGRRGRGARPDTRESPPAKGPPAAAAADDDWKKRFSLSVELGPGGVLADYTPNPGPNTLLLLTGLRANYDFTPLWTGSLVLRQWWLPNDDHALMLGPGAQFDLLELWTGRVYVDGSVGLVSTSRNWTAGFDVGAGAEWEIPDAPGVSIGPYFRLAYVSNPNDNSDNDGGAWSFGAVVSYHFGRAGTASTAAGPRKRGSVQGHHHGHRSRRRRRRQRRVPPRGAGQTSQSVPGRLPRIRLGRGRPPGLRGSHARRCRPATRPIPSGPAAR